MLTIYANVMSKPSKTGTIGNKYNSFAQYDIEIMATFEISKMSRNSSCVKILGGSLDGPL